MSEVAIEALRERFESVPAVVPNEVIGAVRAEAPALRAGRRTRIRRRIAIAMAVALALTGAAFTPPGRAATHWVSDWLAGPNTFEPGQYGYQLHTSTLIGSGELPTGDPYQVRGYINANGSGKPLGCIAIVWQHSEHAPGECLPPGHEAQFSIPIAGRLPEDEQDAGAHGVVMFGAAPHESTEVRVRVPKSPGVSASDEPAQLFPIDGMITDTTGASAEVPPVQIYVAYLPPGAGDFRSAPPAHAVALSGGQELGSTELSWIRFTPSEGRFSYLTTCVATHQVCQTYAELGP
jgi:hypothetical protein